MGEGFYFCVHWTLFIYHEGTLLLIICNFADKKLWIVNTTTFGLTPMTSSSSSGWPRNWSQSNLAPSSFEAQRLWKGWVHKSICCPLRSDKMKPSSLWIVKTHSWFFQIQFVFVWPRFLAAVKWILWLILWFIYYLFLVFWVNT